MTGSIKKNAHLNRKFHFAHVQQEIKCASQYIYYFLNAKRESCLLKYQQKYQLLLFTFTLKKNAIKYYFLMMPFISKDWRSPGEEWVKTEEGWEKKKVLEHCRRIKTFNKEEEKENIEESNQSSSHQPHCHITERSTKEIAGFNELDEAVKRLDFRNAVRDVRRFNYICALLDHLIGQQMTNMSGCTQKALLAMLEEVARYATTSQHNPRGFRRLLNKLSALSAAERAACWGGSLGSQLLWNQNTLKINKILNMGSKFKIDEPHPDLYPKLLNLPEECLREIILRLSDHRDLTASAKSCEQICSIVNEQRVWRELVKFHFTAQQIDLVLPKNNDIINWERIYHSLKKTYGLNEERQYAEMLSLCKYCKCLFWISLGHPCIAEQCPDFKARLQEAGGIVPPAPIPPAAFLKFFSL